jgi:hypothetical protein
MFSAQDLPLHQNANMEIREEWLRSRPFAGITRIRFKGFSSSQSQLFGRKAPLGIARNMLVSAEGCKQILL